MKVLRWWPWCAATIAFATAGAPAAAHPVPDAATFAPSPAWRDTGPASPLARVGLTFVFANRNARELDALTRAQADPGSPLFKQFVTPAAFLARYAPAAATLDAASARLSAAGFRIDARDALAGTLDASAPVARVEAFFATHVDTFRGARGDLRLAATSAPQLPPGFDDVVSVTGFDGRDLPVSRTPATGPVMRGVATVSVVERVHSGAVRGHKLAYGPDGGYSPWLMQQFYGEPYAHGLIGSGTGIATIETSPPDDTSVNAFLAYFGLKRSGPATQEILIHGGCKGGFCGVNAGVMLVDLEQALGMAPAAAAYVLNMPAFASRDFVGAFAAAVSTAGIDVLEEPQSGCEGSGSYPFAATRHFAREAVAMGKTWLVSTSFAGDGCKNGIWPADEADVLGVASSNVQLNAQGGIFSETPGIGSGGVSSFVPLPAYQATIAGIDPHGRNEPDLTFPEAVDGSEASAYGGTWFGGQSLWGFYGFVSPGVPAGLIADAIQQHGARRGSVNAQLYGRFRQAGYGATFLDITSGCIYGHCARAGYDLATGIGTLDASPSIFDVL